MADLKISQLSLESSLTGTEELEIVTGGVNKRTTTQDIADLGGGGGTWGSIAGTLSSQTDLQNALDAKLAHTNAAGALTSAATIDLTAAKHTLTTALASITFTISYAGDDIVIEVTHNTTASVFTFPVGSLCVFDGTPSEDNTLTLAGVSGDKHIIAIEKIGSVYYVVSKNFTQ